MWFSLRTALRVLLAGGLVAVAQPAPAQRMDVPVMYGNGPNISACSANGRVVGLDPNGDNFLSVLSSPAGRGYREIDRLGPGQEVYACSRAGVWIGIVYPGLNPACLASADPSGQRRPYPGPCRQGWVHSRYIDLYAGGL